MFGMNLWTLLALYNGLVLGIFAWDKLCAMRGWWRVSEAHLFLLAACFGSAGALAGMFLLRHKVRKRRFTWGIPVLALSHLAVGWWALNLPVPWA